MSAEPQTEPIVTDNNDKVNSTTPTEPVETAKPVEPEIPRIKVLSEAFKQKYPTTRSCFVLGATGETGKRIVRDLIDSAAFSLIKIVSRRQVEEEFLPAPAVGVKIEQVIIPDFNTISDDSDILKGCEFGFCALGTTKKKAGGEEAFYKIDHDLTLKLLRLAKTSGCKYLALVSAAGSSASSIFLYSKTKGQLENDVIDLQFDALRIYRPAMLQVKRKEERLAEEVALVIAPILDICSLGRAAVKVDVLADSIVKDALIYGSSDDPETKKHLIFYSNKAIKSTR